MNMVTDSADSILAAVAGVLVPVFRPLGMGDWRICTSLISGFIAKESVVSTLEVLFAGEYWYGDHIPDSSLNTGIQPLVYTMCGSHCINQAGTWNKMGHRCGDRQCVIAWLAALVVHLIGLMIGLV